MPMAGRGSRFAGTGFSLPKPLIDVCGQPMFSWALQSVKDLPYSKLIAIVLEEHQKQFNISQVIQKHHQGPTEIIYLPEVTDGQLRTVMAARELLDGEEDLLIIPSDSLVVSNIYQDIQNASEVCRGIISVAKMPGDHWSFAKLKNEQQVVEVAEKVRISEYASTGLYYFSQGSEFVEIAKEMLNSGEKTKGEFYVIPVYNIYLQRSRQVWASHAQELWDMGNPQALKNFKAKFCQEV